MSIDFEEFKDDPNFIRVLDHGFVYLIDHMGSDQAICDAARVSYGKGTKSVRQNEGLIRYLIRHFHTSPVEQVEVKFAIKLPIFVMRQLIRTRTANCNEYSGRYSEMSNEFYIPDDSVIQAQSTNNKQGRSEDSISPMSKQGVRWLFKSLYETVYDGYQTLLGSKEPEKFINKEPLYDAYNDPDPLLDEDFPGLARELSRSVLSVGNYTECYFKIDLSNLLKMLKLRMDSHAQYEIRVYADAMYKLIQPLFPITCKAAEDYMFQSYSLSRMEINLVKDVFSNKEGWLGFLEDHGFDMKAIAEKYNMTKRELDDFSSSFGS
jgi:thymidylate synthase (FAD)